MEKVMIGCTATLVAAIGICTWLTCDRISQLDSLHQAQWRSRDYDIVEEGIGRLNVTTEQVAASTKSAAMTLDQIYAYQLQKAMLDRIKP